MPHKDSEARKLYEKKRWMKRRSDPNYLLMKRNWDKKNQKEYLQRIRKAVVDALGGKCVRCGFSDPRALQIDHVNGGGSKERKERGFSSNFHKHVLRSFINKEGKYQLLCANCNWIKRFEGNECVIIK